MLHITGHDLFVISLDQRVSFGPATAVSGFPQWGWQCFAIHTTVFGTIQLRMYLFVVALCGIFNKEHLT
jgi:hypothetical protein